MYFARMCLLRTLFLRLRQPSHARERLTLFFKTLTLGYWSDLEYRTSATLKRAPATEKTRRVSIKKSPVYNFFPGYCSCSDTHNISLFFE